MSGLMEHEIHALAKAADRAMRAEAEAFAAWLESQTAPLDDAEIGRRHERLTALGTEHQRLWDLLEAKRAERFAAMRKIRHEIGDRVAPESRATRDERRLRAAEAMIDDGEGPRW